MKAANVLFTKCLFFLIIILIITCKNNYVDSQKKLQDLQIKAELYYKRHDFNNAKLFYDSLIMIDNNNGEYYFKRGYARSILMDNPGVVISDYETALRFGYKEKKKVYLNLGAIFLIIHRKDSGLYYTNKCLELEPNNLKALDNKKSLLDMQ